MNKGKFKEYIMQSLTGFGSLALAILFFFLLFYMGKIAGALGSLLNILKPLVYGLVISFILVPMCDFAERHLDRWIPADLSRVRIKKRDSLITALSVVAAELTAVILVAMILVLIIPELFTSVVSIVNSFPELSANVTKWVQGLLTDNPDLQGQVISTYEAISEMVINWVQNNILPKFQELVNSLSNGLIGFMVVIKNVLIGVIISFYVLFNRRLYVGQGKKLMYSLLHINVANHLLYLLRDIRDIFSGFLVGKVVDSLIIGAICFVGMSIFRFPYAILISTIVGVTNIIPYFGPFIGAIPSAFLVLTVNPMMALYFLIFILALQQLDGNVIGPRILGDSTGLSSFWVLIALILFGGLFGVWGMIVGVPVFAVAYDLAERGVGILLKNRGLPEPSENYRDMDHIDPETGRLIMRTEMKTQTRKDKLAEKKQQQKLTK